MRRREFIVRGSAAAAGWSFSPSLLDAMVGKGSVTGELTGQRPRQAATAQSQAAADAAMEATRRAGATYADVRVSTNRNQNVGTREQRVTGLSNSETSGVGVRVLVDGTWGFAADSRIASDSAVEVAGKAVAQARANRAAQRRPVELAPAQFGGQVFHEIRNGRLGGMLKDVAYQIRTPEFWNSMDLIGGPSTYALGGTFNDGKGQPSQSNAVSHGCPTSRFRDVTVINTARRG